VRCKICGRFISPKIQENFSRGVGPKCWNKLSKTRRFWIKWFG